ncbi:MAG: hypothetical protein JWN44_2474 [Myxococcales bacterium]|nr:hypothetical protein [Myxococcales bacterium]
MSGGEPSPSEDAPVVEPKWRAFVDERVLWLCERHERNAARFIRDWSMPVHLRDVKTHLDPAEWRTGFLQVRERDIAVELNEDMKQLSPQALLRDLYRPVHEERWVAREPLEGTGDRGGFEEMQKVRAARQRPELPRIEPAGRTVRALQVWRRALLAERWEPTLRDDEPRRPVST